MQITLTPSMIIGALERHLAELVTALRGAQPLDIVVANVRKHLNDCLPMLMHLERQQAEFRAAQSGQRQPMPTPPAPPKKNGNASEAEVIN
jgi:hypothetical protein